MSENERTKKPFMRLVPLEIVFDSEGVPNQESLEEAAKAADMEVDELAAIVRYGFAIRKIASEADMPPHHVLSATLNFVGEIIRDYFPVDAHPEICTNIFQQLWKSCGLPQDFSRKK
jgi:hypothetical protein